MDELMRRKVLRLTGFDYSMSGAYFVTMCTHHKEHLFGDVINGEMTANEIGNIAQNTWDELPEHFANIDLDRFVVMPNHVHGIVWIRDCADGVGAQFIAPRMSQTGGRLALNDTFRMPAASGQDAMNRAPALGTIIRAFKAKASYKIRKTGHSWFAWQRNYHERIIRNERELFAIRKYIVENPLRWESDPERQ